MALGELLAPEELLELVLGDLLGSLLPDGLVLAPPEAEPDAEPEVDLSFEGSVALDEELDELGEVEELPLDGEVLDGGVELALPLVLPLLPVVLPVPLSWPQAARPKAKATAAASVESFMCPPWLGLRKKAAKNGPGLSR